MSLKMPIPRLRPPAKPAAPAKGGRLKPPPGRPLPGRPAKPGQQGSC
jgi:hypothetical protein